MKQYTHDFGDLLVIHKGEELLAQLSAFAKEKGLKSAWMSGLGGSGTVTLGYFEHAAKEYEWTTFDDPLEITNLTGILAWLDGEPFWHVHGTFAGRDLQAVGGHVKKLVVGLTCEVLVTPIDVPMTRIYDGETGLKLLAKD